MFSGIVEEAGSVAEIKPTERSIRLAVRTQICGKGLKIGDSLAVNGCCLTVAELRHLGRNTIVEFDLLRETWEKTNFSAAQKGCRVNLERSLQVGDRLGGHFVTGHIDGVGKVTRWERSGNDHVLDIDTPPEVMRYVIHKGSISVDGISLTVAEVRKHGFRIWIIPHTYEVTALQERKVGDKVNLEADLIGKYVQEFLGSTPTPRPAAPKKKSLPRKRPRPPSPKPPAE